MFDQIELGREFFEMLLAVDAKILEIAAAEMCRFCGGPLHRGDFPRKPRGGAIAGAGEVFEKRFSLCCGRDGCRHRATPPSLRFLGRRVYLGAVVIAASVISLAAASARAAQRATGVPPRTLRRWNRWWRGSFVKTAVFLEIASRMLPVVSHASLPASLLLRFDGEPCTRVGALLEWLSPLTAAPRLDGSRWVRGLLGAVVKRPVAQKMA